MRCVQKLQRQDAAFALSTCVQRKASCTFKSLLHLRLRSQAFLCKSLSSPLRRSSPSPLPQTSRLRRETRQRSDTMVCSSSP